MTQYREILRINSLDFSERDIAESAGVSRNIVNKVLKRAKELNIIVHTNCHDEDDILDFATQLRLR